MPSDDLTSTVQRIYDQIAQSNHNVLGDPSGSTSFAYIRVSSSGQAEEGRTGLPRQLQHIHESLGLPDRLN